MLTGAVALGGIGGFVTVANASDVDWNEVTAGNGNTCAIRADRSLWRSADQQRSTLNRHGWECCCRW